LQLFFALYVYNNYIKTQSINTRIGFGERVASSVGLYGSATRRNPGTRTGTARKGTSKYTPIFVHRFKAFTKFRCHWSRTTLWLILLRLNTKFHQAIHTMSVL